MQMKAREVVRMVEADGWYEVRVTGSHRQYNHPTKPGTVTIAFHRTGQDIGGKTLANIFEQAGLPLPRR